MSMLSSMTEKMRETADKVERFGRRNSDWLWRDATTITRAVVELRDAADTIDDLRRKCQDTQAKNAKLCELVRDMWHELDAATQYDAGGVRGIVSEFADSMRDLGIEVNA
jgi:hypothetical protein